MSTKKSLRKKRVAVKTRLSSKKPRSRRTSSLKLQKSPGRSKKRSGVFKSKTAKKGKKREKSRARKSFRKTPSRKQSKNSRRVRKLTRATKPAARKRKSARPKTPSEIFKRRVKYSQQKKTIHIAEEWIRNQKLGIAGKDLEVTTHTLDFPIPIVGNKKKTFPKKAFGETFKKIVSSTQDTLFHTKVKFFIPDEDGEPVEQWASTKRTRIETKEDIEQYIDDTALNMKIIIGAYLAQASEDAFALQELEIEHLNDVESAG